MSGVVLIISIPTEDHEKCLLKRLKKRVELDSENDDHQDHQSMEKIIKSTIQNLDIVDITWTRTQDNNHYQIIFPLESGEKCDDILDILKENEIGSKLNSKISVMPCTIHYHGIELNENEDSSNEEMIDDHNKKNSGWNIFLSSVRSRLTVAQVVESVKARATMTFDFLMLLLISSTLCALGLVENNSMILLSSMLISPMMGPVMAATFGSIIRDKHLQKIGVQNELIGLGVATLVGMAYGTIICVTTEKYGTSDWPTYEMYSRGEFRSLWVGAIMALLAGAAVALGVLSDNIASLVGVAISTSLMPSAVNAGLLWSLGLVYYLKSDPITRYSSITHTDYFSSDSMSELAALGAVSMCLTFVNIICIYLAAILVFTIKEVAPHTSKDQARRRFWKHDIKIARNYNKSIQFGESNPYQTILDQIALNHRINNLNHFSTDLSKGNFKVDIKRKDYTWSPSVFDKLQTASKGNASRALQFPEVQYTKQNERRRLSQIFPKQVTIAEKPNEKTPLLKSVTSPELGNTYLMSSGKKIVVTPCDLNSPSFRFDE